MPKRDIILDLDETLIHCPRDISNLPLRALQHLRIHHVFFDGELHVIVERPFLREFLRGLRGRRIAVWTAAEESYAQFVVQKILQPYLHADQVFEFVWHRKHCKVSEEKFGLIKHLDMVRPVLQTSNLAIVDDNTDLLVQNNPVFVVPKFTGQDMDDTILVQLLKLL